MKDWLATEQNKTYKRGNTAIYRNGNYLVIIKRFTKIFRSAKFGETKLISKFPDNIDLKLTNSCNFGCEFCHENSVPGGKCFDPEKTKEILSQLPHEPIEIALGGGDLFTSPGDVLKDFVYWCLNWGFLVRLTIKFEQLNNIPIPPFNFISNECFLPVGISLQNLDQVKDVSLDNIFFRYNTVYHIIAGIFPPDQLYRLFNSIIFNRILILGYKSWGRGKNYTPPYDLKDWSDELKRCLHFKGILNSTRIAFDNLAIEQLGIRDTLTEKEWKYKYMGPEFTHSMYIDAVKGEFAKSSTDKDRISWDSIKLLDFYGNNKV